MNYYILSIISIWITTVLQISIAPVIQVASVVPNLLIFPLIFFSLGLCPKYKPKIDYFAKVIPFQLEQMQLRGISLGFIAGLSCGINSQLLFANVFSWTLTGFILGLIAGPINRENPVLKSFLLFSFTLIQGIFFYIPLCVSRFAPSPSSFFLRLLLCGFYTTLLGTFAMWLTEKRREEGVIQ